MEALMDLLWFLAVPPTVGALVAAVWLPIWRERERREFERRRREWERLTRRPQKDFTP